MVLPKIRVFPILVVFLTKHHRLNNPKIVDFLSEKNPPLIVDVPIASHDITINHHQSPVITMKTPYKITIKSQGKNHH